MPASCPILVFLLTALFSSAQQTEPAAPVAPVAATFSIHGTVVDASSGAPLTNTTVTVAPATGNRIAIATVASGEDGRFAFEHLRPGKYSLVAQRRGYGMQGLDQHEGFSTAVVVGPNAPADDIVFRLNPDASISGQVLDEAQEPVRNARLMLVAASPQQQSRGPGMVRNAQTDDRGFYHFSRLPAGSYYLAVLARPWYAEGGMQVRQMQPRMLNAPQQEEEPDSPLDVTYPVTFYPAATDEASASPIVVAAGARVKADMMLTPVRALHLKIRVPETDPQAGVFYGANLRQKIFGTEQFIQTNSYRSQPGVLEVSGFAPGQYEINMNGSDGKGGQLTSRMAMSLSGNAEVDATNRAEAEATVSGTLQIDPPGLTGRAPTVFLRDASTNRGAGAQVAANGEFKMPQGVPPGRYAVTLPGPEIYLKSLTATGARVIGHSIEIRNEPVKLVISAGIGMGVVSGVVQRNGKPLPGAMVVLVPQNLAGNEVLLRRDQSDSDGSFEIPGVVPGRYIAIALERWDVPWENAEVLKPYLAHGQAVDVQPRSKQDVGNISVQ